MSNLLLHIKDAYYFEVPKFLWRSNRASATDFPDWVVRNDSDFQQFEADSIISLLRQQGASVNDALKEDWLAWQHQSANFGRPLDVYLEMGADAIRSKAVKWSKKYAPGSKDPVASYLAAEGANEIGRAHV